MTLWTIACQAPLSMGFFRQECWSGLPCSPPGDHSDPGIEPASLCLLHCQAGSLPLVPPGKPRKALCACMLSLLSHVQFSGTLWTVAHQAPLSMGFSRQEYSHLLCNRVTVGCSPVVSPFAVFFYLHIFLRPTFTSQKAIVIKGRQKEGSILRNSDQNQVLNSHILLPDVDTCREISKHLICLPDSLDDSVITYGISKHCSI